MIRLGFPTVSLYPTQGIVYENHGGTIVFNGLCTIGNNSAISIGTKAIVKFGDRFAASTTLRLTAYNHISFSDNVCFWLGHIGYGYGLSQVNKSFRRL